MTAKGKLGLRQLRFLELYLGKNPELAGNGTQCYMEAYGASEKVAAVNASKLLTNTKIKTFIDETAAKVAKKIECTATDVLEKTLFHLEQAAGNVPMVHEEMVRYTTTDEDGNKVTEYRKVTHELRQTNLAVANQLLNTLGKNKLVQAFQENIEVSHSHRLVEILNERTKKVAAAAEERKLRLVGNDG